MGILVRVMRSITIILSSSNPLRMSKCRKLRRNKKPEISAHKNCHQQGTILIVDFIICYLQEIFYFFVMDSNKRWGFILCETSLMSN